jgi:hypothetical protein
MKKLFIFLLLSGAIFTSNAQEAFLFKIKFLPGHIYNSVIQSNMNMEMNVTGDSAGMARLKAKGIKLPMTIGTESKSSYTIKTGSVKSDQSYPIMLTVNSYGTKKTVNGAVTNSDPNPMLGQHVYGEYNADGKMDLDSISGTVLNDQIKQAILKSINSMINQLHFPDSPLKIGDTFTQDIPFKLPLGIVNLNATIKIIYKLTTVKNNRAYFDMDESMSMDMYQGQNEVTMTVKGSGKGMGTLVYDINNNFAPLRNANLKMNYEMLTRQLTITGSASISTTQATSISTNN